VPSILIQQGITFESWLRSQCTNAPKCVIVTFTEKALKMSMIQLLTLEGARTMASWITEEFSDISLGDWLSGHTLF